MSKKDPRTTKPRLPKEARVRLSQGAAHRNKKKYDRKRDRRLKHAYQYEIDRRVFYI